MTSSNLNTVKCDVNTQIAFKYLHQRMVDEPVVRVDEPVEVTPTFQPEVSSEL